jgi:tRNA(Ile)-lysidine synthase
VLDEVADEDLQRIGARQSLPLRAWRDLSPARRSNALRAWLARTLAGPVPQALVERVLEEARDDTPRRWPVDGARMLQSLFGQLLVAERLAPTPLPQPADARLSLLRCDRYELPGWSGALEVFATGERGVAPHRLAQIEARVRAGGERFLLHPAGVARSLKKQWQSQGVPARGRDGPLVYDGAGALLFVPGLGIDARAWAPPGAPQWGLRWLAPA